MIIKRTFYALLTISLLFLISSCYPKEPSSVSPGPLFLNSKDDRAFNIIIENAADSMLSNCTVYIDKQKPIIVASLVNIDDMKKSSTLGRMSSEIIANRIAQQGFRVQEIKMSQSDIFVSEEEGEMILSRNMHQIGRKHDVQGFVVGTYAVGQYHRRSYDADVYVAIRFVDTNNIIGCSASYIIPNTDPSLWK